MRFELNREFSQLNPLATRSPAICCQRSRPGSSHQSGKRKCLLCKEEKLDHAVGFSQWTVDGRGQENTCSLAKFLLLGLCGLRESGCSYPSRPSDECRAATRPKQKGRASVIDSPISQTSGSSTAPMKSNEGRDPSAPSRLTKEREGNGV